MWIFLVALALASVTNQSKLSFGEFVEGHQSREKRFVITKSTNPDLDKYIRSNKKIFVIAQSPSLIQVQGTAGSCSKTNKGASQCTFTIFKGIENKALQTTQFILFSRKDITNFIWSQTSSGPVTLKYKKDGITLTRVN